MSSGRIDDTTDEGPVPVLTTIGESAWHRPCVIPDDIYPLLLMLGNGIDGDVRFVGNNADAIAVARGLVIGTGACKPMEPPTDSTLYQPGDECYRQHGDGRAFIDPQPTGDIVHRQVKRVTADDLELFVYDREALGVGISPGAQEWSVGSLRLPRPAVGDAPQQAPRFVNGRDRSTLYEGARVVLVPFRLKDGNAAVYLVLREKWKDQRIGWAALSRRAEMESLAARLNQDIDALWRAWRGSPAFTTSNVPA